MYIERTGQLNVDTLFKNTTKDRIVRYYVREYERQRHYLHPICCAVAGKKIESEVTIVDLKGGSSSLLSPAVQGFVQVASELCQEYYPEFLSELFVVNGSWIVKAGWWIVKGFLDSRTVNRTHVMGSNYEETLLKCIDAENLPDFLGGKCSCKPDGCLQQNDGPWKSTYDKFPKEENLDTEKYPSQPPKWKQPK